jgi:hypothetical protein
LRKLAIGHVGHGAIEVQQETEIGAQRFERQLAPARCHQAEGRRRWLEEAARRRLERGDSQRRTQLGGRFARIVDNGAMADMETVEIAQRQRGALCIGRESCVGVECSHACVTTSRACRWEP